MTVSMELAVSVGRGTYTELAVTVAEIVGMEDDLMLLLTV